MALALRLVQVVAAQLSSLPPGQPPAAAADELAQAAAVLADAQAELPVEFVQLHHWASGDVVAAADAMLLQEPRSGKQVPLQDAAAVMHARLSLLGQAAALLESGVDQAGPVLPGQTGAAAEGEAEQQQQQQLAMARALKPLRCAHLGCTNVAGSSEADLPSRLCSACRQVRYCSAECAAAAWRQHRPACKLLQQQA